MAGRGRGQIVKKDNNRYMVRIYTGRNTEGKRMYYSKTLTGKKVAEQHLTEKLREIDTGTYIEPSTEKLSAYLETWLTTAAKQKVRAKTYSSYRQLMERYIIPEIGEITLPKLKPEQIQKVYNEMSERGLSPRTVRYTHTVLKGALSQAVKWNKLYRNPADIVELPRQEQQEMKYLTPAQAQKFIEATVYSPYKAFFTLLIATGMRPSEAHGLKWQDIDYDGKKVVITRALTRTTGEGWRLDEPKTKKSKRSIPLPDEVIKDLREHRKMQARDKEQCLNQGIEYQNNDFIFANEQGEPLHERNMVARHFKPILEHAKLPDIRLYDLRHSCATLLLSAGENPKVVSERLGHASVTLTLDTYSHVLPDMQKSATNKISDMLFGS